MRLKNEKGAVAVEFAFVLPVLILILFGIIEFSIAFFDQALITNASREGARQGILLRPTVDPLSDAEIGDVVTAALGDSLISFDDSGAPVTTVTREDEEISSGDALSVTVNYNYSFLVLPGFMEELTGPITLSATTTMRME